jgi:5-methylcytosine-specific restriction endonuclease McrA
VEAGYALQFAKVEGIMNSPFHHEKRRRFSPRERAEIFAAADEKCANCGRKIPVGEEWDLDHTIALSRGGDNDRVQVLCQICHGAKTSVDLSEASKGKRVYESLRVPRRFRQSKGWGRR